MDDEYREVYFHEYCKTCKHKDLPDVNDPCNECLEYPVNLYSHRPINWKPAKGFEGWTAPDPYPAPDRKIDW